MLFRSVYKLKGSGTYFHREKVMTRDLNTDDALYKIGLILQGQDTSANSGLIEGVRSVLTQEQVDYSSTPMWTVSLYSPTEEKLYYALVDCETGDFSFYSQSRGDINL